MTTHETLAAPRNTEQQMVRIPVGFKCEDVKVAEIRDAQRVVMRNGVLTHREVSLIDACLSYTILNANVPVHQRVIASRGEADCSASESVAK